MTEPPNVTAGSVEIDLRRIQEGTHPLVLDGNGGSLTVDAETGRVLSGFRFEGEISSERKDHRVRGSLTGTLETACDRCLTRIDREVRAELDVRVVVGDEPVRDAGESSDVVIHVASETTVLDLADSLRAAVLLEVPIKNLCRDDCRGICPRCGVNRNRESCDCQDKPADPRWDALKGVFGSTPRGEETKE